MSCKAYFLQGAIKARRGREAAVVTCRRAEVRPACNTTSASNAGVTRVFSLLKVNPHPVL